MRPIRKPNRLPCYDYSTPGVYFLTLCTQDRQCILSSIVGGGAFDAPAPVLTPAGQIVEKYILSANRCPGIRVDKYVIMPNHVHLLVAVEETVSGRIPETASNGTSRAPSPTNAAIPHFVSTLKRFCHREIGGKIFQRSYHDHVVRCQEDYLRIWNYIDGNPALWQEDCFYTEEHARGDVCPVG